MRKFQSIATLCGDGLRPELGDRSSLNAIYSSRRHDPVWTRPVSEGEAAGEPLSGRWIETLGERRDFAEIHWFNAPP
jgi:hypothetical protein